MEVVVVVEVVVEVEVEVEVEVVGEPGVEVRERTEAIVKVEMGHVDVEGTSDRPVHLL